jgi:hypothetical protein
MRRMQILFALALSLLLAGSTMAQTVKVTIIANSSAVPDTLWPDKAVIQIRGDTSPLTWDGKTGATMTNIGGDYWKVTLDFPQNAAIAFKFFSNAASAAGDQEHKGWEQDILSANGNRNLQTGTTDTTLPIMFVNGSADKQDQYWRPWDTKADSISVRVRVNMQGWEAFNPATDFVGVRGAAWPGYLGNLSWAHTLFLSKEAQHGNGGSRNYNADNFYSGTIKIPRDSVSVYQGVEFKFVILGGTNPDTDPKTWESRNNRVFTIPVAKMDTTLLWSWFNDVRPAPFSGNDTLDINFSVDLTRAIQTNGFVTGDTISVRTGWAGSGRDVNGVSPVSTLLTKQGFTNTYVGTQKVIAKIGSPLYYQYYLTKLGQDIRETYYNYDYTGSDNTLAERRMLKPATNALTVTDNVANNTDAHRSPLFRNTRKLTRVVNVTWVCDLRPAYYQVAKGDTLFDIQGTDHVVTKEQVYTDGLWMNGPATDGWTTWGRTLRDATYKQMWDDGTHGDAVAGDHFYTVQFTYGPDSTGSKQFVGQEFKFGIHGGDNEGGKGGFGNNHYENIDDSQGNVTITTQFGVINPKYYNAWDFDNSKPTSVDRIGGIPVVYKLDQNYPNPFNPSTNIEYSIPTTGWVTLKVYNMLGQEMTTLVSGPATPGQYRVVFDASRFESGVYMYQLSVGDYKEVRKMTLVK